MQLGLLQIVCLGVGACCCAHFALWGAPCNSLRQCSCTAITKLSTPCSPCGPPARLSPTTAYGTTSPFVLATDSFVSIFVLVGCPCVFVFKFRSFSFRPLLLLFFVSVGISNVEERGLCEVAKSNGVQRLGSKMSIRVVVSSFTIWCLGWVSTHAKGIVPRPA